MTAVDSPFTVDESAVHTVRLNGKATASKNGSHSIFQEMKKRYGKAMLANTAAPHSQQAADAWKEYMDWLNANWYSSAR